MVLEIAPAYGQMIALEMRGERTDALLDWMNSMSNKALLSEGMPPTASEFRGDA